MGPVLSPVIDLCYSSKWELSPLQSQNNARARVLLSFPLTLTSEHQPLTIKRPQCGPNSDLQDPGSPKTLPQSKKAIKQRNGYPRGKRRR